MPRVERDDGFVSVSRDEWECLKRRDEDYKDVVKMSRNLRETVDGMREDIDWYDELCDWLSKAYPNAIKEFVALKKVKGE